MSVTVHKLQIRRGEQSIDVLATQSFTVLRREPNLEYAVIDGTLTASIQLVGVQVGDLVELAYTIRYVDPVFPGSAQSMLSNWPTVPIAHLHARAVWDPSMQIHWKVSDPFGDVKEERLGSNMEATIDLHDVQPLVQPKGAPLRFVQLREIEFTSFQSWEEISRRLGPLYVRASELPASSPLNAEITSIKSTHHDPAGRAEAALRLVQDQVRYVFVGLNDGGLVPANVGETWTRRFGDCKAKTALLLAVLHALGVEAEPVAVNTLRGDGLNLKLPMIAWFNHVLVRARIGGNTYWLDGSRSGDRRLENLPVPAYAWGLPLLASGSPLVPIQVKPLDVPEEDTDVLIDATAGLNNPAPFHVEFKMRGDVAQQVNGALVNVAVSEQERRMREYWKGKYDFVDIASVSGTFNDVEGQEVWSMDGKALMDWSGKSYEADGLGLGYKADFEREAGPAHDAPFAVPFPSYSRSTETILLPTSGAGFTIEGSDIDRSVGGVEYHRHATLQLNKFHAEASTRSLASEFSYSDAKDVQSALREMSNQTLRIRETANSTAALPVPGTTRSFVAMTAYDYDVRAWDSCVRGECDNAIADSESALKLNPKDDRAFVVRALAEIRRGNFDAARKDIDAARALNGASPQAYAVLGALEQAIGHPRQAIGPLSTALQLQPGNSQFLYWRARAYLELEEHDLALADTAAMVRASPGSDSAHIMNAEALSAAGKTQEAVAEADAAVALVADDAEGKRMYGDIVLRAGYVYEDANDRGRTMSVANRLLDHAPSSAAYLLRSRARSRTDLAGRKDDIDAALNLEPTSPYALQELADVLHLAGQYEDEIGALSKILAQPKSVRVSFLSRRAVAFNKSGKPVLADNDVQAAVHIAKTDEEFNTICWVLATGDTLLPEALGICDKAIAMDPRNGANADSRAFVLLRLARYPEAITQYTKALELKPNQAASFYGRGIAKHRSGDQKAGDQDLDAARRLDADVDGEFSEYGVIP